MIALAHLAIAELAQHARGQWAGGKRVIWQTAQDLAPPPERLFEFMLSNAANTVAAIELLSTAGFDTQARTLVRRLMELTELCEAILYDEMTLRRYADTAEDFDRVYAIWRKHLTPGAIRRVLSSYYLESGISPSDIDVERKQVEYDQRWLSLASHNYFVSLAIESAHTDVTLDQRSEASNETLHYVSAAVALRKTGEILRMFLTVLQHLLQTKHGWTFDDEHAGRFSYLGALFRVALDVCDENALENEGLEQGDEDSADPVA
jgi:hypothetical protein